ncbi:MAG: HWE histidine kinase domain-containing protein [Reyranella sp.]
MTRKRMKAPARGGLHAFDREGKSLRPPPENRSGVDSPFETIRVAKNGRLIPVSVTVSPIRDSNDRITGASTSIRDITERKRSDEQIRNLMLEGNHRAKNLLGVVSAIARQSASSSPADFTTRFTERIRALSANMDLLVKNDWKGVDTRQMVKAQLAHLADSMDTRIAIEGPDLRLNAAAAQAIGMALHELATNATKHGALSAEGGRVEIDWTVVGGRLNFTWRELGGPPVQPPTRRGFGSTVLTTLVEASVKGAVDLSYDPDGVIWRLNCPVQDISESKIDRD